MKFHIFISFLFVLISFPSFGREKKSFRSDSILRVHYDKSLCDLTRLGYQSLERGEYDEALTLYTLAISKENGSLNDEERREYLKALNNIGYIYLFDRHNPEIAYPYFLKARHIAEEADENVLLAAILDNIAKIHDDFGDAEKAIDLYNQAMAHAVKGNTDVSPVIQIMILNDIINCGLANELTERILPSLELFSVLPEYSVPLSKYSKSMCEGLICLLKGDTENAIKIIKNASPMIDAKVDSTRYVTNHQLALANLYHLRNMEDSAKFYLDLALSEALKNNLPDRLPRIYKGMTAISQAMGDSVETKRMKLLAYEADESIHSSKMYAFLTSLESSQEINNLNVQLLESNIRNSHRTTVIWILCVAVILIGGLLALIFIRNRNLAASHRELVARHQSSINNEEINTRIRREYEETIISLQDKLEKSFQLSQTTPDKNQQKAFALPVNVNERISIIEKVNDVFATNKEIYDEDFSLERLAEITDTKSRYLSAVLNESLGKSFNIILAEARIKRACELLLSPDFKKTMTIQGIAMEVGYRSRTHFTSVFKKITGVTPLQYASMAK